MSWLSVATKTFMWTAFCILSLGVARADCQETREQQIAAEQEEKAGELGTEGPTRGEQVVVRVMNSPLLAGSGGVFPWFGSVFEGTGLGLGGGYLRRLPHDSKILTIAGASINGSSIVQAEFSAPNFARDTIEPRIIARWIRANDLEYYGLGNESSRSTRDSYNYNFANWSAGVTFKPTSWFRIAGTYEQLRFDTDVIEASPVLRATGLSQTLSYQVTHLTAALDWRTSASYSASGGTVRATVSDYGERQNLPYDFRQLELEGVELIPLVREQFGLAFRALATFTSTEAGNQVPVPLLPILGSGSTLRGFTNRRFADTQRLLLTGEYRWRPSRYVDMAVFLDEGQVAPTRDQLGWDRFRRSWGVGARFHGPTFTAFRIDVARSSEGTRLILSGGQAF